MPVFRIPRGAILTIAAALIVTQSALADENPGSLGEPSLLTRATASVEATLDRALDLIGIRYRRGGNSPETGFDCSGYVRHVFREGLGLYLPRSALDMSSSGTAVDRRELRPGDLVFFNTMRRTFSHVGIYLGDNLFVHAPRSGTRVRIEDMREKYWARRYNGARRVADEG